MAARPALAACGAAILALAGAAWGQDARDCIQEQSDGTATTLTNRCAAPVSVAYCPPQQVGMQRACGDAGTLNLYYTDMVDLGPGQRSVIGMTGLRIAACHGAGTAVGLAGFSSDRTGAYKCPAARAAAAAPAQAPQPPARKQETPGKDTVSATATDARRACELARSGFPDTGSKPPCDCRDIRKQPLVVMCTATGRLAPQDRDITSFMRKKLIEFIERQSACDPDQDEQRCEHMHKLANPGGIRG